MPKELTSLEQVTVKITTTNQNKKITTTNQLLQISLYILLNTRNQYGASVDKLRRFVSETGRMYNKAYLKNNYPLG